MRHRRGEHKRSMGRRGVEGRRTEKKEGRGERRRMKDEERTDLGSKGE